MTYISFVYIFLSLGIYIDYCCGSKFKQFEIFNDPNTLQIQIALDETELCDALKSKAGNHKTLAIYMQIRNTPEEYRSRLNTIYLVALCVSGNLKENVDNFFKICRLIRNDLKILGMLLILYFNVYSNFN